MTILNCRWICNNLTQYYSVFVRLYMIILNCRLICNNLTQYYSVVVNSKQRLKKDKQHGVEHSELTGRLNNESIRPAIKAL